jgi:hypothetical protein
MVLKFNLQFDKELKHFRIQQLNYENEDVSEEIIEDVTQVKKVSQKVVQTNNVVKTTTTVKED